MSDSEQQPEILELPLADTDQLGDPVIWRYIDFFRFQEILDTDTLFFPTKSRYADLLEGTFGDDHLAVQSAAAQSVAPLPDGSGLPINDEDDWIHWNRTIVQHENTQAMNALRKAHQSVGISCWTCRKHEMVPLWSLYTKPQSGVAIRSRLSGFRAAVSEADAQAIHVGRVRYIESRPAGLTGSSFHSLLYKSLWWEHEKEIRFMMPFDSDKPNPPGCSVPVDLSKLIDGVVISPIAAYGFADTVKRSMQKANLSARLVEKSAITGTVSRL